MKKLIDIIITIAKGGRALRGHDENSKILEKGLFLEIVELISRYDPVMKDHLEKAPKNSTYLSPDIQNDIIKSIQNVMLRSIISSIKCKPVSIIADETTDLGHNEQLSSSKYLITRDLSDILMKTLTCLLNALLVFIELKKLILNQYLMNYPKCYQV